MFREKQGSGLCRVGPGVTFIRMNQLEQNSKKKVKKKKCLGDWSNISFLFGPNYRISNTNLKKNEPKSINVVEDEAPEADRFTCVCSVCAALTKSSSSTRRSHSPMDRDTKKVAKPTQDKSSSSLVAAADSDVLKTVLSGWVDEEDLGRLMVTQHEYRLLELLAIKKWQQCLHEMKAKRLHKKWRKEREKREIEEYDWKQDNLEVVDQKSMAVWKAQQELLAKEKKYNLAHKAELERKQQKAELKRKQIEENEKQRIFQTYRCEEEEHKERKRIIEEAHSQYLQKMKCAVDAKLLKSEQTVIDERNKLSSTLRMFTTTKQELAVSLKSEIEMRLDRWRGQVMQVQLNNIHRAEEKARRELEKRREQVAEERKTKETRHQQLRRMYEKIVRDHQVWHKKDVSNKHNKVERIMNDREKSLEMARYTGFKTAELRDIIRNRPCSDLESAVRAAILPKNTVTFTEKVEKVIPKAARIIQSCIHIQAKYPRH